MQYIASLNKNHGTDVVLIKNGKEMWRYGAPSKDEFCVALEKTPIQTFDTLDEAENTSKDSRAFEHINGIGFL
jgi:hypothetical protein